VPSLVADKREDGAKHAEDEVGLLQGALGSPPKARERAGAST
jgi:hypothetical protein